MINITHPKVAGLEPCWAPFAGCTILFSRIGTALGRRSGVGEAAASLHALLGDALTATAAPQAWRDVGFCPLPIASFHMTVCDLIHAGNVRSIRPEMQAQFAHDDGTILDGETVARHVTPLVERSGILAVDIADLAFGFNSASNRGNRVIVAEMACGPQGRHRAAFERLMAARARLDVMLREELGVELPPYEPHVSLGYFANSEAAADSVPLVGALDQRLKDRLAGRLFGYGTPALYIFADMSRYDRVAS